MKSKNKIITEVYLNFGKFCLREHKDLEPFEGEKFPFTSKCSFYFEDGKKAQRFCDSANMRLQYSLAGVVGLTFSPIGKQFKEPSQSHRSVK